MNDRYRTLDLILVALSAPLWVPLFAVLGLVVLVTSGRPILFTQTRVGRNGELFTMRKFRSMTTGNNPVLPDPTRVTRVGRHLRRTSLDELPQLLNVLEGTMSLVGPRPLLPQQLAFLDHRQMRRHRVRPGLTGLAQVNGRNALTWDERFEFDLAWAERRTSRRYIGVLVRTIGTVLFGTGVDGHNPSDRLVVNLDDTTSEPTEDRKAA